MLRMNRMEEKQLNFAKPLLSVRRFPPGATLGNDTKRKIDKSLPSAPQPPRYRSELKTGPVRNPGTVPFTWEQSPGLPKEESQHKARVVDIQPHTLSKFPHERSSKVSQDAGRPNSGDEEDERCVEAQGTLSRTESFFINCSISGLEDLDTSVSDHSLIDSQTMDLMMGRFLPAAIAMTSESPQHVNWKLPAVSQQLNQLKLTSDDYEEHENIPSEVCGRLPPHGLRSSVFLGSPLRGTSVRTLAPVSPFRKSQTALSSYGVTVDCNGSVQYKAAYRTPEEAKDPKGDGSETNITVHRTFKELLAEESRSNELDAESSEAEKTVVSDHKEEPPAFKPLCSDMEVQLDGSEHQKRHLELPLPPPLPKTPSDSWLCRTLPSVSGKNGSAHKKLMSGASTKHQLPKPKSSNLKWETMVKMTEVQDQHFRYSKERLRAIPEA